MVVAGNRRRSAAVAAGLASIDVMVCDADEAADAMRAVSENLIRASMNGVDVWRAIQSLEAQAWNEQAIADALALPVRTVRKLKLLAHLHPPMLDVMATGNMPNEDQLRTIAAASREEQTQVWKKNKPKKGQDFYWHDVARALAKRRIPFSSAKFDDELAQAYGVTWHDDLFAPAGEEGRYTIDVEGFFGAQQEWLSNHLPERAVLLTTDEYGRPVLPKKAEHIYGKPSKSDVTGYYLDGQTGEARSVAYRMPEPKAAPKRTAEGGLGSNADKDDVPEKPSRAPVTQKGMAMIGDLRTDALHEALAEHEIDDQTLMGLLVLALGANNVAIHSGAGHEIRDRSGIVQEITAGGVLSSDYDTIKNAARKILVITLSCRDNMSNSGTVSRVAGEAIGAALRLPTMATEEFLSCLSKQGIESVAAAEGVKVYPRGKDTRAAVIDRFKTGTYVYPPALFSLSDTELGSHTALAEDEPLDENSAEGAANNDQDGPLSLDAEPSEAEVDMNLQAFAEAAE